MTRLTIVVLMLAMSASAATASEAVPDPALLEKLALSMATSEDTPDRFDAEVWLKSSDQRLARFVDTPEDRLQILTIAYREAYRQQLDPDLVMAVMEVESHFDRFAVSSAGAQGMMQIMPFWRLELGRDQDNLTDVETNIRYGTTILAHYLDISDGDLVEALGRYNGSRGKLRYPERVVTAWRNRWRSKTRSELPALQASCSAYALKACRLN